tara:strand:+ start:290 stop:2191 length:1902 start_codon:yes stop_codon:yes gene_type:complete
VKSSLLKYRPEVDGLRAIAVGAVMIYHAQIRILEKLLLPGGFLGVDIFFVISGYLITYLIIKEKISTNNFSFKNFYERRARRILPALFFMLIIMLPFSYVVLIPSDFKEYILSNLFAVGFTSNYFFYFSEIQYGSLDSFLKPLLHTWSLGVEEQFYIFFPILIILFFNNNWSLKRFFFIFILLSFLISSYLSIANTQLSFFSLLTRIWELLFGSLTAYLIFFNKIDFINKKLINFLSYIGVTIIFLSFIFFEKNTYHPSYLTLFPVIGTCLVLINLNSNNIVQKILSSKIFVFVGLISYSLYLYHYPILSFSRYYSLVSGYNLYGKIALMFAIFIISYLSYFFIERPFRDKKKINTKKLLSVIILGIVLMLFVNLLTFYNKLQNKKFNIIKEFSLDNRFYKNEKSKYSINKKLKKNKVNILIIGNSHAVDSYIIFNELYSYNDNLNFILLGTQISCLKKSSKNKLCREKLKEEQFELIEMSDYLVFSTRWSEEDVNYLDSIVKKLNNEKNKIIIMSDSPTFHWSNIFTPLDKFVLRNNKKPSLKEIDQLEKVLFKQIPNSVFKNNKKLEKISKKNNLTYLNKFNYACNLYEKKCKILTSQNKKIYYDNSHYTLDGNFYFVYLFKKLGWSELFK